MNKISIVTPSYNQGQYIEETIKSVLSQEGDFFIDYIITDGGSADNSVEIIKKYDDLLKNGLYPIKCKGIEFRWWSKKDKGQTDAINQGFKIAKGKIIAYINSDDFYEKGAFQKALNIFNNQPNIDLIYGSGYILQENTKEKILIEIQPNDFNTLLFNGCNIFQPSTFMKHSTVKNLGYLDENLHYVMDYDLWLKIFKNGKTILEKEPLSTFRLQTESKTVSQRDKFNPEIKILRKRYGGYIIDRKTIGIIRSKIKLLEDLKKYYPKIYFFIKNIFYSISDKFTYKRHIK